MCCADPPQGLQGKEPKYAAGGVAQLDLFLKWSALRFFDTNTSVLLKSIQFLQVWLVLNHLALHFMALSHVFLVLV